MLGYTLAQVRIFGTAIEAAEKRKNADMLLLMRCAEVGEEPYRKIMKALTTDG